MFRNEDPLDKWSFIERQALPLEPSMVAKMQAAMTATLDRLAETLDNPPPKPVYWYDFYLQRYDLALPLVSSDTTRAQKLYWRVVQAGGTGITDIQQDLLSAIGTTADPASISFWLEALEFARPREVFAKTRRRYALAALAWLAIRRNLPAAYEALREAIRHANPDIRALAVHYLGRAYLDAGRPIPDDVLADLARIAVEDSAFLARFETRALFRIARLPVPNVYPEGAYAFKVTYKGLRGVSRTIELLADQTLDDLHFAIQHAFKWDADHLYSFYMDDKPRDSQYEITCPQAEGDFFSPLSLLTPGTTPQATAPEADEENDVPGYELTTSEAVIGELGLGLKQKFLYLFDYGDQHLFQIQVAGVRPLAEPGKYPRVIASQGKAPPQYWSSDDDQYDDEDAAEDTDED